jgi:hypothetical protein
MSIATTTPVEVQYPDIAAPHLHITVGPCTLRVRPGEAARWVRGDYRDPSGKLPLHVTEDADGARIAVATEPEEMFGLLTGVPALDLELGTARPFAS